MRPRRNTISYLKGNLSEMIARWEPRFEHDRFISSFYQGFDEFRDYYSTRAFLIDDVVKPIDSRNAFQLDPAAVCYREKDYERWCIYIYIRLGILYIYICAACISYWIDSNVGSIDSRWFRYWRIPAYQALPYSPTRFFFPPPSLFRQDPSTIAIYFP